jgi:hypothetical protein
MGRCVSADRPMNGIRALTTIEIDFDVYKLIEAERQSFDEPRIAALRRLLKLPAKQAAEPLNDGISAGRSWSGEGVTLVHGTRLRMRYNGRQYEGEIVDGKWVIEGKTFDSPSGAASGIAITKSGNTTRLDGWIYWEVQAPSDTGWTPIKTLRPWSGDMETGYMVQLWPNGNWDNKLNCTPFRPDTGFSRRT